MEHEVRWFWMTKLDAGLMTSLPASDPGSTVVWGSKRINPRPQSCLCLTWSGYSPNDDDDNVSVFSDRKMRLAMIRKRIGRNLRDVKRLKQFEWIIYKTRFANTGTNLSRSERSVHVLKKFNCIYSIKVVSPCRLQQLNSKYMYKYYRSSTPRRNEH